MYSGGMTTLPNISRTALHGARTDLHAARRHAHGEVIRMRAAEEISAHERHEHRVRLSIWLGILVPIAAYLAAAYGVGALDAIGLLP